MSLPLLKSGPGSSGGGGSVDLLNGLLAWYRNDEVDWSGNEYNFTTVFGSPGLAPGIDGTPNAAARLGSIGAYNRSSIIPNNLPFTVSVWFYEASADYVIGAGSVFREYDTISGDSRIFYTVTDPASNMRWEDTATALTLDSGIQYTLDQWVHFVITNDDTNVKFYINGSLVDQEPTNLTLFGTSGMDWGSDQDPFSSQYLGIWNRALNLAEIQTLYNAGDGFDPTFIAPTEGNQIIFLPPSIYYQF